VSDHPPESTGPAQAGSGQPDPPRSLSEILEELALISHAQRGDASAMRGAVSELTRALARLFEMIRADRADQRTRIAELELALQLAHTRIHELEAGEIPDAEAAPDPSDFDQLRDAAERLRKRTAQLVKQSSTPAEEREHPGFAEAVSADAAGEPPAVPNEPSVVVPDAPLHGAEIAAAVDAAARAAEDERLAAAREAVERSLAEDERAAAEAAASSDEPEQVPPTDLPHQPVHDEPFGPPGILRVFPGAVLRPNQDEDLDIESELIFDEATPLRAAAQAPRPVDESIEPMPDWSEAQEPAAVGSGDEREDIAAQDELPTELAGEKPSPVIPAAPRPEPVAVLPRPARKRRGLRRRKIDARKLRGVEPAAALRAMVSAVDTLWTAGNPLDLVIALTDGGALRISGGDRGPLQVADVEPGIGARCTITATRDQIVPLFGRLELTADQSAPLIHGSRRDADLLVGWIDRAQRLAAEPL
jgi:hypothetical protein